MAHELQTLITTLFPRARGIRLTEITIEDGSVRLQLPAAAPTAGCPRCAVSSSSVHSRYQRHLTDLPWATHAVHLTRLRRASEAGHTPEAQASPYTRPQGPSARAVSFAMVCPAAKRSADAQRYLDQLCAMDADIARAYGLSQTFLTMVRERRGAELESWMAEAMDSGLEALARFARGLRDELAAVTAGRTLEWSNGATEGHVIASSL